MSGTRTYNSYCKAKSRCTNPRNPDFGYYGGKGIQFRFASFEAFFAHMGCECPPGYTLERLNVHGHYEVGNVCWAPRTEQVNNRTNTHLLKAFGKTRTFHQWARKYDIHPMTLWYRLKVGWSVERALTTPPRLSRVAAP